MLGVAAFTWFMLSKNSWRGGRRSGAGPARTRLHHPRDEHDPESRALRPARLPDDADHRVVPQAALVGRYRYWLLVLIVVVGAAQMWWWTEHYLVIENLTDDLYP